MYKIERNSPCPCGSGKKYYNCCYSKHPDPVDLQQYNNNLLELLEEFGKYGIDISEPGFYDEPAFMAVERMKPDLLNKYATYVESKNYTSDYLFRAEKEIPLIANALYKELERDGRLGACLDISSLLSRCLEKEGYWNYIVVGPLSIKFNSELGIKNKYFWAVDKNLPQGSVAHSWVVAPPFNVIDLSIRLQPYKEMEEIYLPDYIISDDKSVTDYSVVDIIAPEVLVSLNHNGIVGDKNVILNTAPHALSMINQFPPLKIICDNAELKYITMGITAPDCSFKEMLNISLCGKTPYETYQKVIIPLLHDEQA